MKRKSILALILSAMLVMTPLLISGCGNSNNTANNTNTSQDADKDGVKDDVERAGKDVENTTERAGNDVKNTTERAGEDVKNTAERIGDDIKYTAVNFKDAIVNAGYDVKDSLDTHKDYFKGTETDYLVGDDLVRIYEYDTPEAIDEDIATISGNGTIINGTSVQFTNPPTYYRSGDTLIVYEGNNPDYINQLNTLYGAALVPAP